MLFFTKTLEKITQNPKKTIKKHKNTRKIASKFHVLCLFGKFPGAARLAGQVLLALVHLHEASGERLCGCGCGFGAARWLVLL